MPKKKEDDDITKKPKKGKGDVGYAVVKSVLAAFPYLGGTAAEVFAAVIAPPISKRRDEWIESIAERLVSLEKKVAGSKLADLSKNKMFITSVMQVSQVAVRNHQKEKLEALRNAILNCALEHAPEEDLQLTFLHFVDTLTVRHIKVLEFFNDPKAYAQRHEVDFSSIATGSPNILLLRALPELGPHQEFCNLIYNDLYQRGLFNTTKDSFHTVMGLSGMLSSRTTKMGKQFIQFISEPPELSL